MQKFLWLGAAIAAAVVFFTSTLPGDPPSPARAFAQLPPHFEPTGSDGVFMARGAGFALELGAQGAKVRLARGTEHASLALKLEGSAARGAQPEDRLPGVSNYFLGRDPRAWRAGVPHYQRVRYQEVYPGVDLVYYGAGRELEYDFLVAPGADPARIQMSYEGASSVRIDAAGDLRIAVPGGEVIHRRPETFEIAEDGARRRVASAYRVLTRSGRALVSFDIGKRDPARPLVIDPVLNFATYFGGSNDPEQISAMVVDSAGSIYIAGHTTSNNFPVSAGAAQGTTGGGFDAFVTKLNSTGTAVLYSTYLGGASIEEVHALRVDAAGNAYVSGATGSADFPTTAGAAQTTHGGNQDVFVSKLNAAGSALTYSTYLGGSENEPASSRLGGFEIDAAGNAYVYGDTESSNFPTSAGAPQATRGNANPGQFDEDVFLTRLNASGTAFSFSTYHGGSAIDATDDVSEDGRLFAIDGSGIAWIAGSTESADFPTTAGAFDTTFNGPATAPPGGGDAFVARYDTNAGTRSYSTLLGGTSDEFAAALAVDASGNAYLAARSGSSNFPTTAGAADTSYNGGSGDVVIAKLNPTGSALVYATFLGGTSGEAPTNLSLDATGSAYVAGSTQSTTFFVTAGAADTTHNGGGNDGFIARLNAAGSSFLYSTFAGSSDSDGVTLLEIDAAGSAYALLGDAVGTAFVSTGGLAHGGNADDYFVKLNAAGNTFLDASYFGGSEDDFSLAMAVDAQQNLYLGGSTSSANLPVTAGVVQPAKASAGTNEDAFLVKFATTPDGPVVQPGQLAFTAAAFTVGEAAGTASISVARSGGSNGAVSATCTAATLGSNTATAGSDYTAGTVTLNWADGDAANKTCSVTIANDSAVEGNENFTVTLGNATGGATLGATATASVTITDDDVAPVPQPGSVSFNPSSYSVNENGGSVTLTLTRTAGADGAISVSVNSGGGSASAGADYTALSQTVNWVDGDAAAKTLVFNVLDDSTDEPDETVNLTLTNATGGASLGTASATVNIVDNDATPVPPGPVTQPADVKGKYGGGSMDWWLLAALAFCVYCLVHRHRLQRALPALVIVALAGTALPAPAAEGWYLGVRGGWSDSTQNAGDIQRALNSLGHDVQVSLEDTQHNFALLGGYAFESGLSLEASLFDLGEFEVAVSGETTAPGALPSDALTLLGHAGRGISASLGWTWQAGGNFELTPRLGAYYWETRHEVQSAAGTLRDREFGVDLTAGLRLAWRIDSRWQLGLDFDSWAADGRNDVRTANIFVSYAPGGQ